jgi:hypothetical protein
MSDKKTAIELDSSELATVLAALRLFQREYEDHDATSIAEAWPMHFDAQVNPLDSDESEVVPQPLGSLDIDKLCERINCAPDPALPIIFLEGGLVQDVFYPVPDPVTGRPFTAMEYDIIDYDIFDGTPDEEIAEYFQGRDESTRNYMKKNLPDEYKRFADAVRRHKRAQRQQTGRIQLPKGKTANDRAKERVEPATKIIRRYIAQTLPIGTGRTITIDVAGDGRTTEAESMDIAQDTARKKLRAKSLRVTQGISLADGDPRNLEADYVIHHRRTTIGR